MNRPTPALASLFLTLVACGGGVIVEDDGGGGQGAGASGQGGSGEWEPCAGKVCGDTCDPCDPADPLCELPGTNLYCNSALLCGLEVPVCPSGACATDADCAAGAEWCISGACYPCDDSGDVCDIGCNNGWSTYQRNGCHACACAPPNQCAADGDCGAGSTCYAGALCWDYCPPSDPSCCQGNICSLAGCEEPPPVGCVVRGCPFGENCDPGQGCTSSGCSCSGDGWGCDDDCGGGECYAPIP